MATQNSLPHMDEFSVGWVVALPIELKAAESMLDEKYPPKRIGDTIYSLGRMKPHLVVITCLPQIGTNSAAMVVTNMKHHFPSIEFSLMVGVGGGVPSQNADIRLGDIVVSKPTAGFGGVVQYDMKKTNPSAFERTGFLNAPPNILLTALATMQTGAHRQGFLKHLSNLQYNPIFSRDRAGPDILYQATYLHPQERNTCDGCNKEMVLSRVPQREELVMVHYGTIASGNQVIKDGLVRDQVSAEFNGVLCFEMEAAGLMNSFPSLVIRGICDYADSHKNKNWQPYAAGTAAAYAKELLSVLPILEVQVSSAGQSRSSAGPGHSIRFTGSNYRGIQLGVNEGTMNIQL